MAGFVSLVGAGPGDAQLLTLKALRCLQQADIVLHDRLISSEILELIPRGVPRIFAGKSCKIHYMTQTETNAAMIELARSGKRVVRLKGGDPFIFGRGGEEAQALAAAGIAFEIIPGITAATACAAYAGIPLTHRDFSHAVHTITGHLSEEEAKSLHWAALAAPHTTLVVYMGLVNAARIRDLLIQHGRAPTTPTAAIQNGSTPQQRVLLCELEHLPQELAAQKFESPTLLIIGEVAALAPQLQWFTPNALSGDALPESSPQQTARRQ